MRASRLVRLAFWVASLRGLESFVHEFERYSVVAVFGVEAAAEVAVELVDLDALEAAGLVDMPADLERHLVHDAEDVPACGLGELDFSRVEAAEHVDRQRLLCSAQPRAARGCDARTGADR